MILSPESPVLFFYFLIKSKKKGGFVIKNVTFSQTFFGNPLYPGQQDFDLLLCFRYDVNTANNNYSIFSMSNQGSVAASGIIHANVLHYQHGGTRIRFGMLNYYTQSINYEYLPTLVRIGGVFDATDDLDQT